MLLLLFESQNHTAEYGANQKAAQLCGLVVMLVTLLILIIVLMSLTSNTKCISHAQVCQSMNNLLQENHYLLIK